MFSRSLSRMVFVIVIAALTLTLTAGDLAQGSEGTAGARKVAAAPQRVPVVITSPSGPVREESLPPETRAQVERVRKAAESLVDQPGTSERIKVKVTCSFKPLKCTVEVEF
jgi:hypothetical protein